MLDTCDKQQKYFCYSESGGNPSLTVVQTLFIWRPLNICKLKSPLILLYEYRNYIIQKITVKMLPAVEFAVHITNYSIVCRQYFHTDFTVYIDFTM